jgi:ferredoxin
MKIAIDLNRCSGHARCAAEAPSLFTIDPADGTAVVISDEVPEERRALALRAASACPETAVLILEEEELDQK